MPISQMDVEMGIHLGLFRILFFCSTGLEVDVEYNLLVSQVAFSILAVDG